MPAPDSHNVLGLENYLFDRYLHTILRIFIILTLTLTPLLLPFNLLQDRNETGGVRGLDRFSFANVSLSHTDRYWVHLTAAIFVVVLVSLILQHELQSYRHFLDNIITGHVDRSTILLVSASKEQLTSEIIQRELQGIYSYQAVEATIQSYYFAFLFIQIFLVASFSASITTVFEKLKAHLESIPVILVQNLPKASNYFFSYLIIYTSATVTSTLPFAKRMMTAILSPLLDKTPRQVWTREKPSS